MQLDLINCEISEDIFSLVGNTPMHKLSNILQDLNLSQTLNKARIYAKLENYNLTGSIKDRTAMSMIKKAQKTGKLKQGGTIVEATSGNTGISLSAIGAVLGYEVIIVMPDSMSEERISMMRAYGAKVILTNGSGGMAESVKKAIEICSEQDNCVLADQFNNPANVQAHYEQTGPEIWKDTCGAIDVLVAGVGTGGTLTGCAKYLKEQNPDIYVVAIEPAASPLLSSGAAEAHGLQGIGANFVPSILDVQMYDEVICVSDQEAYQACNLLSTKEGLLLGISSGAALAGALKLQQCSTFSDKNIVFIAPDSGNRYISSSIYVSN